MSEPNELEKSADNSDPAVHTLLSTITEVLRSSPTEAKGGWTFRLSDLDIRLPRADIEATIASLDNKSVDGTVLFGEDEYEVLISEESDLRRPSLNMRLARSEDGVKVDNPQLGLRYQVGPPTDAYVAFFLRYLASIDSRRGRREFFPPMGMIARRMGSSAPGEPVGPVTGFDFLRAASRFLTLRIESDKRRRLTEFSALAHAFYFHLSFNYDIALVPTRSFDSLVRSRPASARNRGLRDLEPPRRTYVADLVDHYQMAVGSQSVVAQFLSYYHVSEHFFEEVFTEDLVGKIRDEITQPDFAIRRSRDVRRLIKIVTSSLRARDEEVAINEEAALRLTLRKFVDPARLSARLEDYDESLTSYYASTPVGFCDAPTVELDAPDADRLFRSLSKRIYAVRNAVVHAKEGSRKRYRPFEHDSALRLELPLMRVVAELVIIGSGMVSDS